MRIVGIDVASRFVVACLLDNLPADALETFHSETFHTFNANSSGITGLLSLQPDVAILEPTGINYARLWGTYLARNGVAVYLVGHSALKAYRSHLRLPLKDDRADALALACYGLEYLHDPRRFLQVRQASIVTIRKLSLRLAHLNRCQSPIINRARQDLAWQFPEAAGIKSLRTADRAPLLWAWLAGLRKSGRYDAMLGRSVGLGIEEGLRLHAARLCDLQEEEIRLERQLGQLLSEPEFADYLEVFKDFGFGQRVSAIILGQVYPIDNFLSPDGRPIKEKGRRLSERRFRAALGVAPTDNSSGNRRGVIVGGSDICRTALWLWRLTRIEPQHTRPKGEVGRQLVQRWEHDRARGSISQARGRFLGWAATLLFRQLIKRAAITDF
jgi:transposase